MQPQASARPDNEAKLVAARDAADAEVATLRERLADAADARRSDAERADAKLAAERVRLDQLSASANQLFREISERRDEADAARRKADDLRRELTAARDEVTKYVYHRELFRAAGRCYLSFVMPTRTHISLTRSLYTQATGSIDSTAPPPTHTHTRARAHAHTHTHTQTQTHTLTHTHTHTHTHTQGTRVLGRLLSVRSVRSTAHGPMQPRRPPQQKRQSWHSQSRENDKSAQKQLSQHSRKRCCCTRACLPAFLPACLHACLPICLGLIIG
jgi:hypothetical protein